MDLMDREAKRLELERLRAQVLELERELALAPVPGEPEWPPRGFYGAYAVTTGFVLGALGAIASLLFNMVGSAIVNQNPLHLIQVYLTFPLGEPALQIESGLAMAVGCCLYLLTGMTIGIPFQYILTRWFDHASVGARFAVVTTLALALWAFNFYVLIGWLQPLLIGGNWILDSIPWWVGASTHLVFGWTMLAVQPLGRFVSARAASMEKS
jgi:hypothetical protein